MSAAKYVLSAVWAPAFASSWFIPVSLTTAALFWIALIGTLSLQALADHRMLLSLPMLTGISFNAAASLANGGQMPGAAAGVTHDRWWQPMTEASRLPWLCDVLFGGTTSVGDVVLLVGGVLVIAMAIYKAGVRESVLS